MCVCFHCCFCSGSPHGVVALPRVVDTAGREHFSSALSDMANPAAGDGTYDVFTTGCDGDELVMRLVREENAGSVLF